MSFWDNQSFSFPQDRENLLCPWADIRRPPKESSSGGRYAKREKRKRGLQGLLPAQEHQAQGQTEQLADEGGDPDH